MKITGKLRVSSTFFLVFMAFAPVSEPQGGLMSFGHESNIAGPNLAVLR